jgi:hypothetical protein
MSQLAYEYTLEKMEHWIGAHGRPWESGAPSSISKPA